MYGKNKKTPSIGKIIGTTAVVFMAASTSLTFASDSSSTGQQQFMKMPPVFASGSMNLRADGMKPEFRPFQGVNSLQGNFIKPTMNGSGQITLPQMRYEDKMGMTGSGMPIMGTGGKFQGMRQENSNSRQQINQNHKDMADGLELSYFIRADLTSDEQVALKTILNSQRSSVETTMKDSSLSTDDKTTKLKTIFAENIPAVLQYVSSDKQDEFKSMMDKRLADIISNIGLHGKIQDNREMMKSGSGDTLSQMKKEIRPVMPQSVLSQSLKTKLDTAISNFSVERLQKILSNIDAAITKVQPTTSNDKKKAMLVMQLKEIRDIVATKINELNGGVDDVLGSILNDTTTSSGFGQ